MKSLFTQTRREKAGTVDGINLFFGALIGANLGTVGDLPAWSYAQLMALLVGLVITIRHLTLSERRFYAFATLAAYVLLFAAVLYVPALGVEDLAERDLHRLTLTLAIWIGATLLVEFLPVRDPQAPATDV